MRVEVVIGDWDHHCCGDVVRRGDRVDWTCYSEAADGTLHETHHDLDGFPVTQVRGTIVHLLARETGQLTRIDRVPSGRALCGFDPDDDGTVFGLESGAELEGSSLDFVVVVEHSH
ncbi:DUF6578 domain-containing protein [Agromyces aureus]|uniref:DUF6578 domain-containing protein n=1 Tax=Agromyces aureus TaxID=453304 RepID=UPI0012601C3F|nr:DUF6578 domain-containing protein [Agromyces aureus]